jgi:hypothetical protein
MNANEAIARAQRAELFLKDPLWDEAWAVLQTKITAAMIAAKTDEGTIRGKQLLGLMVDLRQHWERVIKDGAVADHQLKLEAEEKNRRFRLFTA